MTVATKTVVGRRTLRFETLDDLLADVRTLAAGEVEMLGNWTLAQILGHLAVAYNGSIDGLDLKVPWLMKKMVRLFMKNRFLEKDVPAGFQIPEKDKRALEPAPTTTTEDALTALEAAVERLKTDPDRVEHPVLGRLTKDEWTKFHLRHAEMHLSFVKPKESRE